MRRRWWLRCGCRRIDPVGVLSGMCVGRAGLFAGRGLAARPAPTGGAWSRMCGGRVGLFAGRARSHRGGHGLGCVGAGPASSRAEGSLPAPLPRGGRGFGWDVWGQGWPLRGQRARRPPRSHKGGAWAGRWWRGRYLCPGVGWWRITL